MIPKRPERVAEEIHRGVAVILERSIKDPRLHRTTITHVKMSPDLKHAGIYFSIIGDASVAKDAIEGFQRARPFIRKELVRYLKLRWTPNLHFYYDDSIECAFQMSNTLDRLKKEREENPEADRECDSE